MVLKVAKESFHNRPVKRNSSWSTCGVLFAINLSGVQDTMTKTLVMSANNLNMKGDYSSSSLDNVGLTHPTGCDRARAQRKG